MESIRLLHLPDHVNPGKSTLLRATFPDYEYVSLENNDVRLFDGKKILSELHRIRKGVEFDNPAISGIAPKVMFL